MTEEMGNRKGARPGLRTSLADRVSARDLEQGETGSVLFLLPHGIVVSGIVMWALRLSERLQCNGWRPIIAAHRARSDQETLSVGTSDLQSVHWLNLPATCDINHNHERAVAVYTDLIRGISECGPLVVLPNVDHHCWGAAVEAAQTFKQHDVKHGAPTQCFRQHEMQHQKAVFVGWTHSNTPYDVAVSEYYEPTMAALIAPSRPLQTTLADRLPHRRDDIRWLPYPVSIPEALPNRFGSERGVDRKIHLLYTGRFDSIQKHTHELLGLAHALNHRGVNFEMRLIGDGPDAASVRRDAEQIPGVRCCEPMAPADLQEQLAWADLFVLTSRWEGLSVAMLEAMAFGVVPIITRVSGVEQVVQHGVNGLLYEAGEVDAAADAIAAWDPGSRMCDAAAATARTFSDPDVHARYAAAIFRQAIGFDSCAPTAFGSVSDSELTTSSHGLNRRPFRMPSGGLRGLPQTRAHVRRELGRLLARFVASTLPQRVAVWGGGAHTHELADLLKPCPAFVAVIDDAAPRRTHADQRAASCRISAGGSLSHLPAAVSAEPGRCLGRPLIHPSDVEALGITDVIISSALYEEALWQRRGDVAPAQVHRLYASIAECASASASASSAV
ncbi:MAG: glycosyltransferase family 4 protein [Planctomycetota bacterium]